MEKKDWIILPANDEIKIESKKQIKDFEGSIKGKYRYSGVDPWRGIVCELLISRWLDKNYEIKITSKGIDTSGIFDRFDILASNGVKIEVKSATKNEYNYLMPKKCTVDDKPKDLYIGAKYNETVSPNECCILGFTFREYIQACPVEQDKGTPYYKFPMHKLWAIEKLKHYITERII